MDVFIAGVNGEMDWVMFGWDDELKTGVDELTTLVDLILLRGNLPAGFVSM